ncbi:DNA-binding domain-containing protein [Shewanella sp. 5S214]|uniref:DNA-binding domain-containing protein n=1 Tax=Shewanella sp. 5S214 TaxID=3229999 RepID=UPI00352C3729
MAQYVFKTGMVIVRKTRHYKIAMLSEQLVTLESIDTKSYQVVQVEELLSDYQIGTLTLPIDNSNLDRSWLTESQIADLKRFNTYLNYLDVQEYPGSDSTLRLTIEICADLLNEPINLRPSISTLRRWYAKWCNNNKQALYLLKSRQNDPSLSQNSRLDYDMRLLIDDIVDSYYLTQNGPTVARCYKILMQSHLRQGLNCKVISRSSFYREIKKLDEIEVIRHRQGSAAANAHNRSAKHQYEVNGLFERFEMDAVHSKIYLIDHNGDVLGTPIIFLLIDVFSRRITGMHISMQSGETNIAAVSALRHAILPKPVEDYLFLDNKWSCFGQPMSIYVDSGKSFINASFDSLLAQLKIHRIAGQTRLPWKRSFIERFNKTLRNKLIGLPGYLGKRVDNFTYDKPGHHYATLTPEEFEKIVCILINDEYHVEPHSGLKNNIPNEIWDKNIRYSPPILPPNIEIFDNYLRAQKKGTIQELKGIQYLLQFFNSDELKGLYKQLKKVKRHKEKVTFLVDNDDASNILVINPLNQSLLKIPNTRKSSIGCGFQELQSLSAKHIPNNAQQKIDKITQQAVARKKKAVRDKQKTIKKSTSELSTFDSTLTQNDIELMMSKREQTSHKQLNITSTEHTLDVPKPSTPKIIKYKTN